MSCFRISTSWGEKEDRYLVRVLSKISDELPVLFIWYYPHEAERVPFGGHDNAFLKSFSADCNKEAEKTKGKVCQE